MDRIQQDSHQRSKLEALAVLRRIGVATETIAEIDSKLPDRFDIDEAGALLQSYGLTCDEAMSRLGGGP